MNFTRRAAIFFSLLLCFASTPTASAEETVAVWPKVAPGEAADAPPETVVEAKPGDNTIRLTDVTRPILTFYRPTKELDTGAAAIVCPGGGYGRLAYNKEGSEIAEWLASVGVTGIVLKYRVPARNGRARHEAPLQDAQRALGLVRHRAAEWGFDAKRIGIIGFSAGGHLAAAASTNFARRTYDMVDEADAASCRPDFTLLIYPAYLVHKDTNAISPELPIGPDTPPTFIAMTEDDGVRVEGALFYYLALKQAKIKAEMHLYPVGGHGYGLRPSEHTISTWPARAADWLRASGIALKP
jgi:acetyl esterase/lipase